MDGEAVVVARELERLSALCEVIYVDFDVDVIDRDGELFLIEFNMRFGVRYPVSQLAGAGFPELLVRAQRGKRLLCEPISRGMFS